ncbi:PspC domain-containing protein [Texcoconibacillus texcoconensis]|uniref:Phage shock protein PspC (Stress-responsive transcriptional regulator) n=1 Tax=Texcoconibacillus texcoconensis TaxID=1095777 RepID=A0A840QQ34_9BACI|nr:PspC domain-containing protein [Texcoconibacillus texcoconensis]MBB5173433.1 phage shock protein PspC (stress-responsive transcriptional regulator) [Texcoconibacillus texcoconensis]
MKRLYRTEHDRKIGGVCGGVAQYFNIDSTVVRILFLLLMIPFAIFPVVIAYAVGVFIMPNESDVRQ